MARSMLVVPVKMESKTGAGTGGQLPGWLGDGAGGGAHEESCLGVVQAMAAC